MTNFEELNDWKFYSRRGLEQEIERVKEKEERLMDYMRAMDAMEELCSQVEDLKDENERLAQEVEKLAQEIEKSAQENNRLRKEVEEKEMKLSELGKLSVGVAKKSSQDEVLKALRTYINISKRKTLSKRVAVKVMIMELANAIDLSFPEDMVATLEALDDDEQAEPKVMVQGNVMMNAPAFNGPMYDVHGNDEVKLNS